MALVRPLYVDATEGLPVEIAATDSINEIGGITIDGSITFLGVTNPNGSVVGLPNPPPASDAAASKAYVDSVVSGLDPKANARLGTTTDLGQAGWLAAGIGVGKTLTAPNNLVGNNDFDGVTASLGDRILVKDELTNGADNGIYEVTQLADGATVPTVLTRATDADTDAEVTAGMFLFVTEGTAQADTGWLLTTNDPITVDTTILVFSQFSGAGSFSGGNGIDITGSVISVDLAATPGLEFFGTQLRALVDPAGAVLRGAAGLAINQGNGLAITANVLDVDLAATTPALSFDGGGGIQVDVNAAGAITKTATGLSAAVDGTSIQIVGNQLVAVASPAARLEEVLTAQEALANGDPVEWGTVNDQVRKCQASITARIDCFGVVESAGGIAGGGSGTIVRRGVATGVLTAASVGARYFVGSTGGLAAGIGSLASGDWIIAVGTAKNATDLEVRPQIVARKA